MIEVVSAVQSARSDSARWEIERAATAENSARLAQSTTTLRTYGIGSILIGEPCTFDMPFTHEPAIVSGRSMIKGQPLTYQYPVADIGVRQWIVKDRLYVGALLYVSVLCVELPDGQRPTKPFEATLIGDAWRAAKAIEMPQDYIRKVSQMGAFSDPLTDAQKLELSNDYDLAVAEMLKQLTLVNSITFMGTATKDVPAADASEDPALTPRTTTISGR